MVFHLLLGWKAMPSRFQSLKFLRYFSPRCSIPLSVRFNQPLDQLIRYHREVLQLRNISRLRIRLANEMLCSEVVVYYLTLVRL